MDANTTILAEISFQLERGNPWWGLALCNKYLTGDHPLRQAFVKSFVSRVGEYEVERPLAQQLILGNANQLQENALREQIGARVQRDALSIIKPRVHRNSRSRLAPRTRSCLRRRQNITHPIRARKEQAVSDIASLTLRNRCYLQHPILPCDRDDTFLRLYDTRF